MGQTLPARTRIDPLQFSPEELLSLVDDLLERTPPGRTPPAQFLAARFDAGLAWVQYPRGLGGLGLPPAWETIVETRLQERGAPVHESRRNVIGLGMAAPTINRCGTAEQSARFLRPIWLGEEIWCQLFSEPGAGSDLATLATRAVRDGDGWRVTGHKVWTSIAHQAKYAILLARTDPAVPKHRGLTYFICDMTAPGVTVEPLRQLTGDADFNEVFLDDVVIPDAHRIGEVGDGWRVAMVTLNAERGHIGGHHSLRGDGMIGTVVDTWNNGPGPRAEAMRDKLMQLWVTAEAGRLARERMRQLAAVGQVGAESSSLKLGFATLAQALTGLEVEMAGEQGLRYDDWTLKRPQGVNFQGRVPGYRYLRAKGNSIEGGTSEILRNVIAERVLGLPPEPRTDKDVPWEGLPR